jgi:hypothetical protein
MFFDYKNNQFILWIGDVVKIVNKITHEVVVQTLAPSITWIYVHERKIMFVHKNLDILYFGDTIPYVTDKQILHAEQKEMHRGLVKISVDEEKNIKRLKNGKYVNIPPEYSFYTLSYDGNLVIFGSGYIKNIDDGKLLDIVDTEQEGTEIYDAIQYRNRCVVSTSFGIWYCGKYITNDFVRTNFAIIDNYIYYSKLVWCRINRKYIIHGPIIKYDLMRYWKITKPYDTFFRYI